MDYITDNLYRDFQAINKNVEINLIDIISRLKKIKNKLFAEAVTPESGSEILFVRDTWMDDPIASLFSLILILACKKSYDKDEREAKFILIIDNIETYTSTIAAKVGSNYGNIFNTVRKCFDIMNNKKQIDTSFMLDFTFIFCV